MDPLEIRRIRGSLSRPQFARLLGVTPLTVLRWELPDDNKEARRPRPKMIEALRRLAAEGVEHAERDVAARPDATSAPSVQPSAVPRAEVTLGGGDAQLPPLLEQLCGEQWRRAEDTLTALLSSGSLTTRAGRALATLGLVQVQVLAHMDLRGALAVLVPILDEVARGELPAEVAGRAHVMATLVFAAPDSRVHDLGRVNAHRARAEQLLPPDADDLRVLAATSCIAAARYLGPEVTLLAYQEHLQYLKRARTALARMLADALSGLVATAHNDAEASSRLGGRALEAAERMGHWGLVMGILSDYAHRTLRGSQKPEATLEIARHGRERAASASLVPTEGFIRLLAAECEALCRLGRFADAQRTADEGLASSERLGLARYALTVPLARLSLMTDRLAQISALAEHYERQMAGPHPNAARVHASYLRGLLAARASDESSAAESFELVCAAPDATPGLGYIVHDAHFELTLARALSGDTGRAQRASSRFEGLLELDPSVWYATLARRAKAVMAFRRGQAAEARSYTESASATFLLLGDVVQANIEQTSRSLIAASSRAPGAAQNEAAGARLASLGVSATFIEQLSRVFTGTGVVVWQEQTLTEKLVVATERLNVKGLDADAFSRELCAVLAFLYPGCEALIGGSELAQLETTVQVPGLGSEGLRIGVRARLDAEQQACLTLLGAIVARRPEASPVRAEPDLELDSVLPEFIAAASATRALKADIVRLSRSRATILVSGESGSGKEVVARAVHDVSARAERAYVTLNCASVPRELFEGQLFGYRKGAFTGATADSPGVIRAAEGGSLFLDEIGELPLEMQPKLLRFLENGEVLPIGEVRPRRVDVRVVAATHRDLDSLVRAGRFREDLYYRLNVVPLRVPPLRERKEDIAALARLFIARLAEDGTAPPTLGPSAMAALQAHGWPGNVRELRNVIERAMAYSPVPAELHAEHLRICLA